MNTETDSLLINADILPQPPIWVRTLSFMLDYFLLSVVSVLILTQILLPLNPSLSWEALMNWSDEYLKALQSTGEEVLPIPTQIVEETLLFISESVTLLFLCYFFICDFVFKGSSMGKRIFNLRTISLIHPNKIPFTNSLMRAAAKTLILFYFFPIILTLAVLTKFLHKSKQWGHDLISHTKVVDEFKLNQLFNNQTQANE